MEITKQEIIDEYFDGQIKPKDLKKFKQKTPEGNYVSGYLCLQQGRFLSSMVLLDVELSNGDHIKQNRFIRGMPKQHYYNKINWSLKENEDFVNHSCYEKLDGTCLMIYTLCDEDDNLIEIVPRTRGMAVAANHIIDMFNLVDQAQIKEFYKYPHNYDYVLMFELYGILNRHEITYHRYYIDIKLTGVTLEKDVLKKQDVLSIAFNNHFDIPDLLFDICCFKGKWHIYPHCSRIYPYYYWNEEKIKEKGYNSLEECINALSDILEVINNNYKKCNNHIALEGLVINGLTTDDKQRYVKIKPESVLKMAKLGNGIPNYAIRKESYKYFDEYGIQKVKEIYNKDKLNHLKYIQNNLLEEFPENFVLSGKTSKKIERVFFDIWEKNTPEVSIQNICQELKDKYSDKSLSDIMRIFAKEYPQYKKKSRTVYQFLEQIIGGNKKWD